LNWKDKNLTSFQEKLLTKLRAIDSIVFALADKGLGSVAVDLERYIKDGLIHLTDASTYEIISEEQARRDFCLVKQAL